MRLVRKTVWWERIEAGSLILRYTEAVKSQLGAPTRDRAASDPTLGGPEADDETGMLGRG